MSDGKYRLVTRSDFDGLVCAALLRQMDILGDVKFVHPKDVQDGKVELGPNDITTNLPYHPAVHLAFDHHSSETVRIARRHDETVLARPHQIGRRSQQAVEFMGWLEPELPFALG